MPYTLLQRSCLDFRVLEEVDATLRNSVSGRYRNERLVGAIWNGEVKQRRVLSAKEMLGLGLDSGD